MEVKGESASRPVAAGWRGGQDTASSLRVAELGLASRVSHVPNAKWSRGGGRLDNPCSPTFLRSDTQELTDTPRAQCAVSAQSVLGPAISDQGQGWAAPPASVSP